MKLKVERGDVLKEIVKSAKKNTDTLNIRIYDNTLELFFIDYAKIMMVDATLTLGDRYPEERKLAVSPGDLSQAVKRLRGEAELELDGNELTVTYGARPRHVYRVPLVDYVELPRPSLKHSACATLPAKVWTDLIAVAKDVGKRIKISIRDDGVDVESPDSRPRWSATLAMDDILELRVDSPSTSTYSLDYLSSAPLVKSGSIKVCISENAPIGVSSIVADATIQTLVAPYVER